MFRRFLQRLFRGLIKIPKAMAMWIWDELLDDVRTYVGLQVYVAVCVFLILLFIFI